MDCEYADDCPFFSEPLPSLPAQAESHKVRWCFADPAGCARHQVARVFGEHAVPSDLLPHDASRAGTLLTGLDA